MRCGCSIRSASPCTTAGVLIADTYNHKIKMLDPASGNVSTFAGTGVAGTP